MADVRISVCDSVSKRTWYVTVTIVTGSPGAHMVLHWLRIPPWAAFHWMVSQGQRISWTALHIELARYWVAATKLLHLNVKVMTLWLVYRLYSGGRDGVRQGGWCSVRVSWLGEELPVLRAPFLASQTQQCPPGLWARMAGFGRGTKPWGLLAPCLVMCGSLACWLSLNSKPKISGARALRKLHPGLWGSPGVTWAQRNCIALVHPALHGGAAGSFQV